MVFVLRVLFCVATFFMITLLTALLANLVCINYQNKTQEKLESIAWVFSILIGSVFATLWCVSKGFV